MGNFVIISVYDGIDIKKNIIDWLPDGSKLTVFIRDESSMDEFSESVKNSTDKINVDVVRYPTDMRFNFSKLKNFVSRHLIDKNVKGFVHILEDTVQIISKPYDFLREIERMMTVFKLKSWFNTSCDMCNYVYQKYIPRFFTIIDQEEAKAKYDKIIAWCSNANTLWVCFNFDLAGWDDIRFDEDFKIPMYFIVEFLSRRRNTKKSGELYYMNLYPSIKEEMDVFNFFECKDQINFDEKSFQEENKKFQEMKIDNHPDSSIDVVFEDMYNMIMSNDNHLQ